MKLCVRKAVALALVLCLGFVPVVAVQGDFVIEDNVPVSKRGPGGDGLLTAYNGPGGAVVIPDGVSQVVEQTFENRTDITAVTMPDSLEWIGGYAFAGCTGLTEVTIPAVYQIYNGAFRDCTNLTTVTIEKSKWWTSINVGAFAGCTNLADIYIPNSVDSIAVDAFEGCEALTIHSVPGSAAHRYAVENSIPFVAEKPEPNTAYDSTPLVEVDGRTELFMCYALRDEESNATNYVRLRDLALYLNGTAAQFAVDWDGDVRITTQAAYTPNGSELSLPFYGERTYQVGDDTTIVDGRRAGLAAIVLTDDNGGGYTYYQLRDLGRALGFNVGWTADRGMFVETDKPYDPED